MNSLDIVEQAVRREITSEQAADLLMKQRRRAPQKPAWMPKAVFVVGLFFLAALLPALVDRRS